MIVMIPLLSKSENNYIELRYCLRGIEKHVKPDKVVIVGGLPGWAKNIEHIPFTDDKNIEWKERNIYNKICKAFQHYDEFLFINDDHFLLSPFNYLHNKGNMFERKKTYAQFSSYGYTLQNTLNTFGNTINDFDTHCPIIYEKQKFERLKQLDWSKTFGYAIKTSYVYLNHLQHDGTFYEDSKFMLEIGNVKNRKYFSTGDNCNFKMLPLIYPNKSKYE